MNSDAKSFLFSLVVMLSLSISVTVNGNLLTLVLFVLQVGVVIWQICKTADREYTAGAKAAVDGEA